MKYFFFPKPVSKPRIQIPVHRYTGIQFTALVCTGAYWTW